MPGPVTVAPGWIESTTRQALDTLAAALEEAKARPAESIWRGLYGMGRGGLQLIDLASQGFPQLEHPSFADTLTPETGSAVEKVGEFVGPPLKIAGKLAMVGAVALHKNFDKLFTELVKQAGWPEHEAASWVAEHSAPEVEGGHAALESWKPQLLERENPTARDLSAADYEKYYGMPSPEADALPKITTFQPAIPKVANPTDIVARYTQETPSEIAGRSQVAKENASLMHGLPADNERAQRAMSLGYPDPTDPANWSMRGTRTPRAQIGIPGEPEVRAAHSDWNVPAVFGSFPGSNLYKGYGDVHTPVVMPKEVEAGLFDPRRSADLAEYNKAAEGIANAGPLSSDYKGWSHIESAPSINIIRDIMQRPGFVTYEGNAKNWALFDPSVLRHPLAAFDPAEANTRNLFANFAPIGAISAMAAALAAQQSPDSQ